MSLGRSLLSFKGGLVGKDFRGESVGNLERKITPGSAEEGNNYKHEAIMPSVACSTN